MQNFLVNISLKVITMSDDDNSKILVLLDQDGNFPTLSLNNKESFDNQIYKKLTEFLYEEDILYIFNNKQFSHIEIKENLLCICFNYITPFTRSKKGAYSIFDKKNIDLYRLANNKQL